MQTRARGRGRLGTSAVMAALSVLACGPPPRPTPVDVPPPAPIPPPVRVASLHAGADTTCALRSDGSVGCWGDVFDGFSPTPVAIRGLPPVRHVSVRDDRACAVARDGALWCWGRDLERPVDGPPTSPTSPRKVRGSALTEWSTADTHLITGAHRCGLTPDGAVRCGDADGAPMPERRFPSRPSAVDVGERHACALVDGEAWCWPHRSRRDAVLQRSEHPLVSIHVGDGGHCGLTSEGDVICWGAPCDGQRWSPEVGIDPCPMSTSEPVRAMSFGFQHLCISEAERTQCWRRFRLWDESRPVPPTFELPTSFAALAVGEEHACGLGDNGEVACWGTDDPDAAWGREVPRRYRIPLTGPLGLGTSYACWLSGPGARCYSTAGYPSRDDEPLRGETLEGTQGADAIVMSRRVYSACVLVDGAPRCTSPRAARGLPERARALVLGRASCAITEEGTLDCGKMPGHPGGPVAGPGGQPLHGVTDAGEGVDHACAIAAGELYCWGRGPATGQTQPITPTRVEGLTGEVTGVATSSRATCALVTGRVACWGDGRRGQLGDGRFVDRAKPRFLEGLPAVTSVRAGIRHFCALDESGRLWCWGSNALGQLGDGTRRSDGRPFRVEGAGRGLAMALGEGGTCLAREDDTLCWGDTVAQLFGAHRPAGKGPWPVSGFDEGRDGAKRSSREVVDVPLASGTR